MVDIVIAEYCIKVLSLKVLILLIFSALEQKEIETCFY